MQVRISSEALAALRAHAAEDPSVEACGLLYGGHDHVTAAIRTRNVAEQPSCHFEIDPAALIAAHRAERLGGPKLVGCYHSHPHGAAEPSYTDRVSAAADGRLWLIVAGDEIRAWRAEASGFTECHLKVFYPTSSCRT